jgi:hypothetical protein
VPNLKLGERWDVRKKYGHCSGSRAGKKNAQ